MEEYIKEALQQGFIRPSTSPAASSFFFVAKKDGGLRPCIDYRLQTSTADSSVVTVNFQPCSPLSYVRNQNVSVGLQRRSKPSRNWKPPSALLQLSSIQTPRSLSLWKWTLPPLESEQCCPSVEVRPHPCAFFSKKLSPAEQNYDIGNRELLAIKLALEEWRHWLEGANHPFEVITFHVSLLKPVTDSVLPPST